MNVQNTVTNDESMSEICTHNASVHSVRTCAFLWMLQRTNTRCSRLLCMLEPPIVYPYAFRFMQTARESASAAQLPAMCEPVRTY